MNIGQDEQEFLEQMAKQLDATIQTLKQEEIRLLDHLGEDRVRDLDQYRRSVRDPHDVSQYWQPELDTHEMRGTLDYADRKLLALWSRIERIQENRALAGRILMHRGLV
jgi:hypothetical protein